MKSKKARAKPTDSRDKIRKMREEFRAAEKVGKVKTPLAEKRADTRARRHVTKEVLKDVQNKFNT
jgi:hypothetical protein